MGDAGCRGQREGIPRAFDRNPAQDAALMRVLWWHAGSAFLIGSCFRARFTSRC